MDEYIVSDVVEPPSTAGGQADVPLWYDSDVDDGPRRGFRHRWIKKRRVADDDMVPSPSSAIPDLLPSLSEPQPLRASVSTASSSDHTNSVTNSFINQMKVSNIVLPWEQPWLAPIFGDIYAGPSLSMPAEWNLEFVDPRKDVLPGVNPRPVEPVSFTIFRCIKNKVDRSFLDEREVQTNKAIAKLNCFLDIDLDCSGGATNGKRNFR